VKYRAVTAGIAEADVLEDETLTQRPAQGSGLAGVHQGRALVQELLEIGEEQAVLVQAGQVGEDLLEVAEPALQRLVVHHQGSQRDRALCDAEHGESHGPHEGQGPERVGDHLRQRGLPRQGHPFAPQAVPQLPVPQAQVAPEPERPQLLGEGHVGEHPVVDHRQALAGSRRHAPAVELGRESELHEQRWPGRGPEQQHDPGLERQQQPREADQGEGVAGQAGEPGDDAGGPVTPLALGTVEMVVVVRSFEEGEVEGHGLRVNEPLHVVGELQPERLVHETGQRLKRRQQQADGAHERHEEQRRFQGGEGVRAGQRGGDGVHHELQQQQCDQGQDPLEQEQPETRCRPPRRRLPNEDDGPAESQHTLDGPPQQRTRIGSLGG